MQVAERLSAALADRYRIERELGQGGMRRAACSVLERRTDVMMFDGIRP